LAYALAFAMNARQSPKPEPWLLSVGAAGSGRRARPANEGRPYFPGLDLGLGRGVATPVTLPSSSSAAWIQVLAISSKTWRCRSDLVSPAQRKHSCANSRQSLGDAGMTRSA